MKLYWEKLVEKIDGMSLRERMLIFAAVAFMLVAAVQVLLLEPLLAEQKKLSAQVVQYQEKMKDVQARMEASLQARRNDAISPLRQRLSQVRQRLADGDVYLQSRRDRLVQPEKMADLLEQVLNKNGQLQLVNLQTLPAAPLLEKAAKPEGPTAPAGTPAELDKQVFRHGVQITVRGSYLDLLQYLTALEQLPAKMFWGMSKMNVVQYPTAELTLTLYTLSLGQDMAADMMSYKKGCNGSALLLLCAASLAASAQALTDPTKPPAEISAAPAGQAAAPKESSLQSILISPTRRAAIINGQTIELGAQLGDAKLVEVSESGVILLGPQGRQVLALFPGVEIKRKEPPKENDMKHANQKKEPVKKPASQPGKKEGK